MNRKQLIINLVLVAGSVLFCTLLAETVLHVIGKPPPVVSGWRNRTTYLETNQMGFRGQKISAGDDDYVVVLLGDSQVAAAACAFEWMPERRLEAYLNRRAARRVKVFSLGAGGYGQDQQLLVLQEYYLRYRADLVVLWQTPTNDVWNNVFPTHWPKNGWPKPTFTLEGNTLQGPSEPFGTQYPWSRVRLFALANRLFKLVDRDGAWEKKLPEPYKPLLGYTGPVCDDWQKRWDTNFCSMRKENLETEKSHYAIHLTPVSPRMQYGLDLTRRLLLAIQALAETNRGRLVVFHVQKPETEEAPCPGPEVIHRLNGRHYKTSKKQFMDNLAYINSGLQALKIPIEMKQWRFGPEDRHLNEHAVDAVMQKLAAELSSFVE